MCGWLCEAGWYVQVWSGGGGEPLYRGRALRPLLSVSVWPSCHCWRPMLYLLSAGHKLRAKGVTDYVRVFFFVCGCDVLFSWLFDFLVQGRGKD